MIGTGVSQKTRARIFMEKCRKQGLYTTTKICHTI